MMCLSAEALAVFLNIIATPVTTEPGLITIHATSRDAQWVAVDDQWCTKAPALDQADRLAAADFG